MTVVTDWLFNHDNTLDLDPWMVLPVWAGWAGIAGFIALSLYVLARKVRAYEVVV
jgi:hypothetical protein